MPATYEPIASTTLNSPSTSIVFNNIPNTYTDLRIVLTSTSYSPNETPQSIRLRFNSYTGSVYHVTTLVASVGSGGGTVGSQRITNSNTVLWYNSRSFSSPELRTIDIFSYLSSNSKICLTTESSPVPPTSTSNTNVSSNVFKAAITEPITSINLFFLSGGFSAGTTANIYGIKAA